MGIFVISADTKMIQLYYIKKPQNLNIANLLVTIQVSNCYFEKYEKVEKYFHAL